mmetsp:Transcript_2249/g.8290  ORF Transcript_2249/g.8290 Transcript_2249/m.8290 type:complete len:711 (-) Transcript_2249:30-2162(-)
MVSLFGLKKHKDTKDTSLQNVPAQTESSSPITNDSKHDNAHKRHSGSHAHLSSNANPSPTTHSLPFSEKREQQELSAAEQAEEDQITLATTFQSFKDMLGQQGWSLPELLFGIRWLHRGKQKRDFSQFVERSIKIDEKVYEWLLYYEHHCRICNAFDVKPREEFLELTGVDDSHCVEYHVHSTIERNGYAIVVDHETKEVTMYINGTQTLRDMMVDLHGKACAFMNGYAHQGMALWAKWFYKNKADTLDELLEKNSGYSLVICGHSLGASTSVLAGFLLRERFPELKVIAVAVPKCISESLVEEAEKFVTSFVSMDDFVPLMSEQTWTDLRHRVAQCNWKHYFYNDISSAAPFKAFLKIAPTRFHKFWNKLGEDTFMKRSEEELAAEYRARSFSEKQKVEHYYNKHVQQRDRTNSVSSPSNGSAAPNSPEPSTDEDFIAQRNRSQSAPQRALRPLGTLVSKSSFTTHTFTSDTSKNANKSTFTTSKDKIQHFSSPEYEIHEDEHSEESGELCVKGKHIDDPFSVKPAVEEFQKESDEKEKCDQDTSTIKDTTSSCVQGREQQKSAPSSQGASTTAATSSTQSKSDDAFDKSDVGAIASKKENDNTSSEDGGAPKVMETTDDKLVALYNPGVIYYIRCVEDQWYMTKESWKSSYFEKLEFNRTFLNDHLCASYLKGLKQLLHSYKSKMEMVEKKEAQQRFIQLTQGANDLL